MNILNEANKIKNLMIEHRRYLHENPEVHLSLPKTSKYVFNQLKSLGYNPEILGESGISAIVGKEKGKTIMLRADMDALPIEEETDLSFKSTNKCMHACGHDLHTSMLLGAAKILKDHEDELEGQVKLIFQPAEETFSGAKMMVEEGVLENPKVDAAMAMHVAVGLPLPVGSIMFTGSADSYAAADWFEININGTGCHGASPHQGVDPLTIMAHTVIALQEIIAREVPPADTVVITIGELHGGNISNAIPDTAVIKGTIRTTDNNIRNFAKKRLEEIAISTAKTFRGEASVTFTRGVPPMNNNLELDNQIKSYTKNLLGENLVIETEMFSKNADNSTKALGSEDFSVYSLEVPSIALAIAAGQPKDGYSYPAHHPKVMFDEDTLPYGAAVFANSAIEWLKNN